MTRSTSPLRIKPANDIRRAFNWLIARDSADERKQVAFFAVAALVLVIMIAGVMP